MADAQRDAEWQAAGVSAQGSALAAVRTAARAAAAKQQALADMRNTQQAQEVCLGAKALQKFPSTIFNSLPETVLEKEQASANVSESSPAAPELRRPSSAVDISVLFEADGQETPFFHLDTPFVHALERGDIRLLDTSKLERLEQVRSRQDLEKNEGAQYFLPEKEAGELLRKQDRSVGLLTYGWRSRDNPDPDGETLKAVKTALRSPKCKHIRGLFWDFPSMFQWPRTPREEDTFRRGLQVMANGYASVFGTSVLRIEWMPKVPADLVGSVWVSNVPCVHEKKEKFQDMLETIGKDADTRRSIQNMQWQDEKVLEGHPARVENGRYCVKFASHEEALDVMENVQDVSRLPPELGHVCVQPVYFDRPLDKRGWPVFEYAVSTEAVSRAAYYPKIKKVLTRRRHIKVLLIDENGGVVEPPETQIYRPAKDGAGTRVHEIRERIRESCFTGKGDAEVVVKLFNKFVRDIGIGMLEVAKKLGDKPVWEILGPTNADGKQHGIGKAIATDGTIFEGMYVNGERDGPGKQTFPNGDVFDGVYKNDKRYGTGRMIFFSGDIITAEYKPDGQRGKLIGLRYANKNAYIGELDKDKRGGADGTRTVEKGTLLYANGDVYCGQFKNDKYDGQGQLKLKSGDIYDGFWTDGELDVSGERPFAVTWTSVDMGKFAKQALEMQLDAEQRGRAMESECIGEKK
jgi:hypothetical protein